MDRDRRGATYDDHEKVSRFISCGLFRNRNRTPINRGTSDRGRRNLLDTTNRSIRARFHEGEGKIIRIEYFFPVRAPTRIRHRCDNEKLSVVLLR